MTRLHRSELAVPAHRWSMVEKAPQLGADVVFLDLEDAVPPSEKEIARRNAIRALLELDWSKTLVTVRINSLDTPYCYRDIIEIVEQAGERLDGILIPKVNRAADVEFVATLLSQIEAAGKLPKKIFLHALIETAAGMENISEIAQAAPGRLEALAFGVADYAASIRARTTHIGGANPLYTVLTDPDVRGRREVHWNDPWHFGLARLVIACRTYGLRPIDGPFDDVRDLEGYRFAAQRAAALGCEGKWAIHPSQIAIANEVFTPSLEEVAQARKIVTALEEAEREGRGAVVVEGRMVDAASIKMAQNLISKMEAIEARKRT